MLYRSIYIGNPAYLHLCLGQMKIICPETNEERGSIPIEDLGLLMLDHAQITITHKLIQKLMEGNVVVVSCSEQHLPQGMMLPLYGHTSYSKRIREQMEVSEPLKKQLWKQTVESKISNQRQVLISLGLESDPMGLYLKEVRSGDSTNMEGIAAQFYWKQLFGPDFYREQDAGGVNGLLNFGYSILRSIVAKAIVDTGLIPVLGIFHRNRYNPYCLADDLMEPYRPIVDKAVIQWMNAFPENHELSIGAKAHLLKIASTDVRIEGKWHPLLVAVKVTVSSLYKCYIGEKRQILYPSL